MGEKFQLHYNKPWIMQRADPYIYRHVDGVYYFTASVPTYDSIVLRRSYTLEGLQTAEEKEIWHKHECGIMSEHVWAPELHYLDRKWYIYFAASDVNDVWSLRPYVLECADVDPMTGKWTELGMMQKAADDEFSFENFSLDGTVFENQGRRYYVWAEKVGVGSQISNLYIGELETPNKLKTVQVLLTTPDYDWERRVLWVNEAPGVIKHNDRIFLTYSASNTGVHYCIGMLSINEKENLLDPHSWEKERNPVLSSDADRGIYGPGHNTFTKDEEGNDIMVYHARTESVITGEPLYNPNRHTMLMKIRWGKDGRPVFSYEADNQVMCFTGASDQNETLWGVHYK